jgi:hypothetical protein
LEGAASLSNLREFRVSPHYYGRNSLSFGHIVARFLNSSESDKLHHFSLCKCIFNADLFVPIEQAQWDQVTITHLAFGQCKFDQASTDDLFLQMLEKSKIEFFRRGLCTVLAGLSETSAMRRLANSGLKRLEICLTGSFPITVFGGLMECLSERTSTVKSLEVQVGRRDDCFRAMTEHLPRMRLEALVLEVRPRNINAFPALDWLESLSRNPFLESVTVDNTDPILRTQITKICDRNRGLHRAVENPASLPIEWWHAWWKRIYKDSRELGTLESVIFAFLQGHFDEVVGGGRPVQQEVVGQE